MTEREWRSDTRKFVTLFLNGDTLPDRDRFGDRVVDNSFLVCFNAHEIDIPTILPDAQFGSSWVIVVNTATGEVRDSYLDAETDATARSIVAAGTARIVPARSLMILRRVDAPAVEERL